MQRAFGPWLGRSTTVTGCPISTTLATQPNIDTGPLCGHAQTSQPMAIDVARGTIAPMLLDPSFKGYPPTAPALPLAHIGAQGWQLLRGDLPLPMAVLKHSALTHNLAWMAAFCAKRGLDLAPHGKTTLSPELWQRQLDAGAWGISVANVHQAALGVRHGMPRLLIVNQVLQRADLDGLAALLDQPNPPWIAFLVDSAAQVDAIDAWQRERGWAGHFPVLLELGIAGQRTGCREHDQAVALARRIHASPVLQLVGLECYEGALATCDDQRDRPAVDALLARVAALAQACVTEDLFSQPEVLLTAGGSAIFDLVAEHLLPNVGRPVRGVLRSGCYLTHDHVHYHRHLQCVQRRLNLTDSLQPALEVLSAVQSCPEPGLALLSMGKRDVSYDLDLPVPLWRANAGTDRLQGVPDHWCITALNDQHAYLRYDPACPVDQQPQVGQIVASGISHPCTTFDKWRWMAVVDDRYNVIDAVSCRF